jgi:hypothetical protein
VGGEGRQGVGRREVLGGGAGKEEAGEGGVGGRVLRGDTCSHSKGRPTFLLCQTRASTAPHPIHTTFSIQPRLCSSRAHAHTRTQAGGRVGEEEEEEEGRKTKGAGGRATPLLCPCSLLAPPSFPLAPALILSLFPSLALSTPQQYAPTERDRQGGRERRRDQSDASARSKRILIECLMKKLPPFNLLLVCVWV